MVLTPLLAAPPRRHGLDGDHVTPDDDASNMLLIKHRLDTLDRRLERMEGSISTLQFPSLALYESEQRAQNQRIDAAWTLSMWALGLVCALVVGAIITAIATAVG